MVEVELSLKLRVVIELMRSYGELGPVLPCAPRTTPATAAIVRRTAK